MTAGPALEALLFAAARQGILPLTSVCNAACVFCSHRFNPPGTEVFELGPRPVREVVANLSWLDGTEPVTIGESVTRIAEGEPLTHPGLLAIVEEVRRRYPARRVRLTTNGSLLTPALAAELAGLGVEVVLSLNSSDPQVRSRLMGAAGGHGAQRALEAVARAGLVFEGSLVAVPHLTGYQDISRTVGDLRAAGARCVRVCEPGYTRLTPPGLVPPAGTRGELHRLVSALTAQAPAPVVLEPPRLEDLEPVVAGVLPGSPAAAAGLRPGDRILRIDGEEPFSRVEAFLRLARPGHVQLELAGRGRAELRLGRGQPPGVVMLYDLARADVEAIERAGGKRPLVVTGEMAAKLLELGLERAGVAATVRKVRSRFFGGSIAAAGLLTVGDVIADLREQPPPAGTDLVLLPPRAFDPWGRDLLGERAAAVTAATGLRCLVPD